MATCGDEDDSSDIEVLTVAFPKSPSTNAAIAILDESANASPFSGHNSATNNALLNSISEHEVKCLVNGGDVPHDEESEAIDPDEDEEADGLVDEEIESSALISNYDMLVDENPARVPLKSLVDYSINSNEDSSLLLNQSKEASNGKNVYIDQSNGGNANEAANGVDEFGDHHQHLHTSSSPDLDTNGILNNDYNNRPFFASKLTNSQLSEELSNEIGL